MTARAAAPVGYEASLRPIAEVDPADWASLARRRSFYLLHDWLAVMGGTLGTDLHALVLRDPAGFPALGLPVALVTADVDPRYDPVRVLAGLGREASGSGGRPAGTSPDAERLEALAERAERAAADLYPVLTVVAPGFACGACAAPGLDAEETAAALDVALRELAAAARARGCGAVALLYLPEGADPALDVAAAAHGYRSAAVAALCRLEVTWPTFDHYLRDRPRSRRKSIRAERERFRAGFESRAGGAELLTEELAPLHARWRARYGRPTREAELVRQYAAIRERLGAAVRVFLAIEGGRPAAFALFYEHEGTYYSRAVGFDYDRTGGGFCYYNLLFYEPIEDAIRRGVRAIDYSLESYDAKLGRGCDLRPSLLHLKPLRATSCWFDGYLRLADRAQRERFARLRALHPPGDGVRRVD